MSWLDDFFTQRNYVTIQADGTDLPPQPKLNIFGTGVTVSNNQANRSTDVEITGGGGSVPTGTGLYGITAGVADAAAIKVNLASATYVTGTLALGNGGTGSTDYRSASETFTNKSISGSANTLTNVSLTTAVTGTLPVANGGTGITSLGTGVATFLGTPSSANLRAALTDETGTGAAVFATSPTLSGPIFSTIVNTGTLTLPTTTDTLIGRTTTDTLSNKTLTSPVINTPNFGSNAITTSGYFGTSGTLATTGQMRFATGDKLVVRNGANSADMCMMHNGSGDTLYIGLNGSFTEAYYQIIQCPSSAQYLGVASNYFLIITNNLLEVNAPINGYSGSEFGVHGAVDSSMTDANYTVPDGERVYNTVKVSTLMTAGRTMTWPHPSSMARSYCKTIWNNGTTQTLTISTGTGTTKTLASGSAQRFEFTTGGVRAASATFTP